MKRCVLTANYNGILCDNARQSFRHAAARWGAEYLEATEGNHPIRLHPATVKLEAFMLTDADVIFIIDSDAIISSGCPNPFETLPPGRFSVVGLSQRIDGDGSIARCGNEYEWNLLLELPGVERIPSDGWSYFNSGMMFAWHKEHAEMFRLAFELCHIPNRMGWIEQTPINYMAKKLGAEMHYADERWNFIHGMTLGPNWMDMNAVGAWVYHFAGDPGRLTNLPRIKWNANGN